MHRFCYGSGGAKTNNVDENVKKVRSFVRHFETFDAITMQPTIEKVIEDYLKEKTPEFGRKEIQGVVCVKLAGEIFYPRYELF